ncbi:hypothetical protein [Microbulbifer marinus]|uniref:RcsF protein n=1 Tax=Microbulbifer marinus TaxID=658218 RepID=A0A1H3Z5L7_9GAMM|nr:hypothetical protein [Microbulbifer marinus]SEA18965.1 hypothetical protein SAMN05216562_2206 [Microbulbifer marinus]
MKQLAAVIVTFVISGCDSVQFNTNLGAYTNTKVKAASVREYTAEEIARYQATSLGFVEAAHCQKKPGDRQPSRQALVDNLKLRVQRLGGNGVVVESCGKSADAMCQLFIECRGMAYAVPERKG